MGPTEAKLVVIILVISSAILMVSSATLEDLVVVQCKNQCKHHLHNKKGYCEDKCNEKMVMMMKEDEQDFFCDAFCKPFLEDGLGIYQRCMTVCPRTKSLSKRQQVEDHSNGVSSTRCSSYTEPETHKRCIFQCLRDIISKKIDNEAICESSCSVVQETPLIIRCTRVCHERSPGSVST